MAKPVPNRQPDPADALAAQPGAAPARHRGDSGRRGLQRAHVKVQWARQRAGIRDHNISVRFHQEMGRPPGAYISRRRCELAAELLSHTTWPAWRISALLGFSGLSVFSRTFEQVMGRRPTAWRRSSHRPRAMDRRPAAPAGPLTAERLYAAMAGEATPAEVRRLLTHLLDLYLSSQS